MDTKRDLKIIRIRDDGTYAHPDDNTGNSKVTSTYLYFENGNKRWWWKIVITYIT